HIPLPNDLLLKSSRHVYLTVSDGVRRTYKIGCSPNVLGEITLEGGGKGQTFRSDYPFFVMHMTRRLLGVHFLVSLVLV
ncbi:hypothetical protein S83_004261, partial [Arachis hypogaea]